MPTSSTAHSSSSSPARSVDEPHLHLPAVKEIIPIPKKAKTPHSPRMSLAREKKVLRDVKKKIIKTAKGSIAKVRRRYPGTAYLRDTSSEGSVSSGGGSSRSTGKKLKQGAKLVGNLENANPGVAAANLVRKKTNLARDGLEKLR